MDNEKPINQFQEVHKKVKERLDRAREVREKDSEVRKEKDQKYPTLPIASGNIDCDLISGYPFSPRTLSRPWALAFC
jgi:hypothetical protein